MSGSERQGRVLITVAAAGNVAGALLVSALQVWSSSAATPFEFIGRPVLVVLAVAPLLFGRSWGRWPALVVAASSAIWLVGSAGTSSLLSADGRVGAGAAGLLVLAVGLVPWHPLAATALRRRGRAAGTPEAAA